MVDGLRLAPADHYDKAAEHIDRVRRMVPPSGSQQLDATEEFLGAIAETLQGLLKVQMG